MMKRAEMERKRGIGREEEKGRNAFVQELAARAASGDKTARDELILVFKPLICSLACKAAWNAAEAEDAVQDGVVEAMKLIEGYDSDSGIYFPYYLKRRLTWYFMRWHRGDPPAGESLDAAVPGLGETGRTLGDSLSDPNPTPEERLLGEEALEGFKRRLNRLTPKQREVVEARRRDHLTEEEIAGRLGISRSAVSRRLKAAKKVLCPERKQ